MNPSSMHSLGNNLEGCLWGQTAMDCCRMGEQLELPARVCTSSTLRQAVTKKEMPSGEGAVQRCRAEVMNWVQAHGSRSEERPARVTLKGEDATSHDQGEGKHKDFFKQLNSLYHRPSVSQTLDLGGTLTSFQQLERQHSKTQVLMISGGVRENLLILCGPSRMMLSIICYPPTMKSQLGM